MEWLILGVFSTSLLICIILGIPILVALSFGLLLFLLYGRQKGFSWRELAGMAFDGIKTVSNILITFLLIGVMTVHPLARQQQWGSSAPQWAMR